MRTFICITLAAVVLMAVCEAAAIDDAAAVAGEYEPSGVRALLDVDAGVAIDPDTGAERQVRQFGFGRGGFGRGGYGHGGYGGYGHGGYGHGGFGHGGFGHGGYGRGGYGGYYG